jgi:hypothetical protein
MSEALEYSVERLAKEQLGVLDKGKLGPLDWEWSSRHWNSKPCTSHGKAFRVHHFEVIAKWKLFRFDTAPDGRQIRVDGPSGEDVVGEIGVPERQEIDLPPRVYCKCSIVKEDQRHGSVPRTGEQHRGEVPETGVCLGEEPGAPQATDKMLADAKFTLECEDMNTATVSATNPTNEAMVICVNPGTTCTPNDPTVQTMGVVDRIVLEMGPRETVVERIPVAHGPADVALMAFDLAEGGVLCLNMPKKEPRKGIKFKVGLPENIFVAQLAHYTAVQRYRGVRDQARMWIATDHATFDEIGKTLMGGPAEGSYVSCLYEVSEHSQVDVFSQAYRRCWEPKLIVGGSATEEESEWFITNLAAMDANGLSRWVRANPRAFADLFAADARDWHREHAASVGRLLCASANPAVRAAGVDYLMKAVPVASRAELDADGGLDGIGMWLAKSDAAAAQEALAVFEAYKTPSTKYWASNVSESLPAAIKERAAKLK